MALAVRRDVLYEYYSAEIFNSFSIQFYFSLGAYSIVSKNVIGWNHFVLAHVTLHFALHFDFSVPLPRCNSPHLRTIYRHHGKNNSQTIRAPSANCCIGASSRWQESKEEVVKGKGYVGQYSPHAHTSNYGQYLDCARYKGISLT
jgi:hypothetical protein